MLKLFFDGSLASACVFAHSVVGSQNVAKSDSTGSYSLVAAPGKYDLFVVSYPFSLPPYTYTTRAIVGVDASGGPATAADLLMDPNNAIFTGLITDGTNGQPIPNGGAFAEVFLGDSVVSPGTGYLGNGSITDSLGEYTMAVDARVYTNGLFAVKSGCNQGPNSGSETIFLGQTITVNLTWLPCSSASSTYTLAARQPVTLVSVLQVDTLVQTSAGLSRQQTTIVGP